MQVTTSRTGDQIIATFAGKLSFADNVPFRKILDEVRTGGAKSCIFDFAGLDMVDSSGLGMIMIAIEAAKKQGWTLSVRNAHGPVEELLRLSRLDALLKAA